MNDSTQAEPQYILVQPGLDGVAWLGELIEGEPSPIGKVDDILDDAARGATSRVYDEQEGAEIVQPDYRTAFFKANEACTAREMRIVELTAERDALRAELALAKDGPQ